MTDANPNACTLRDADVDPSAAEVPNWWRVHRALVDRQKGLLDTGAKSARLDDLLYEHLSSKVRIGQSRWLADSIQTMRFDMNVGDAVRRYFEAFVFLCRSTFDCEAYFINDLCRLGLADNEVHLSRLKQELAGRQDLAQLLAALARDTDNTPGTWFSHFTKLRNSATHRTVSGTAVVYRVGGPDATQKYDRYFALEDPEDRKSFGKDPKFAIGSYVIDVLAKTTAVIEATEGVLADYLEHGVVAP